MPAASSSRSAAERPARTLERVLVTGASRGLGLAFARAYAERGDRVFAACRDPGGAAELAALARAHPDAIRVLALDVTDREAIAAAAAVVAADGDGGLDVLVNNAGASPRGERFDNIRAADMLDVLAVNTVAPLVLAQQCHALLARSPRPRIANVSSSMGSLAKKDYGRHYSYASSKAGLNMITRALAADLADDGIVVASLHPGWVRTDLGGPHADLDPADSVRGMIGVIDRLAPSDSGGFLTWQGEAHPW